MGKAMEKLKNLTNRLDKGATYFWAKDAGISWRLVNAMTLTTACGCESRLDALRITRALTSAGFKVAKMEDEQ